MILNLSSLAFGTEISSGGGNPAWGTEMGQGDGYRFSFEDSDEFVASLVYTSIPNPKERIYCPLGKGGNQADDYEFVLGSLYEKVFVNNIPIEGKFLLLVVKKLVGANHVGRRTLKYNPRMTLDDVNYNEKAYEQMAQAIGVNQGGSWFVSEINVKNQDELHFTAHIIDADHKAIFADSNDRSKRLNEIMKKTASLPPINLSSKVRNSFIKFWKLTDQHGADIGSFVRNFENAINPFLGSLDLGYNSIFQVIDFTQYESIIAELATKHEEIAYIENGRSNHGARYEVGSTHMHYRNYLQILALGDFRTNLDSQKDRRLSVISKITDTDHSQYLRAMRAKPFLLLAGISGTGKSRIVKQMAFDSCPDVGNLQSDATSPGNYCLVEVKPNWHDSSELLGYESKINGDHYEVTPFINFLIKAKHYPDVPFFLCLDEMNLAPVEQYFAEFLSVLESRKLVGTEITSEPLIKPEIFSKYFADFRKAYFRDKLVPGGLVPEQYADLWKDMGDKGLRIPSNLIVIGTVNMDETTHQFSRKVIDRAMTIEMNLPEGEPFMDFFKNDRDLDYTDAPKPASLYLPTLVKAADVVAKLASADAARTNTLKTEVATVLTRLNEALSDTPFKIAYRVQNELMLYFYQQWQEDQSRDWTEILRDSVDQILIMKVLPRIEGDDALLEKPLDELAELCAAEHYTAATKKVAEMQQRLAKQQFTSFWP